MSLRKWVVRGLVATALASCLSAGVAYQQWTNPAAVRQQVVEMLQQQFPGAAITLDGARLRLLGGVVLSELRLLRPAGSGPTGEANDFIHIPQATVYHDKELLLQGQFAVRRIEMQRPRIRVVRDLDGHWNFEGLTDTSSQGGPLPVIVIKQGTLVIEDNLAGPTAWEIRDLNLTLVKDDASRLTFHGTGQSDALGMLEVRGSWDRETNATAVSLRAVGVVLGKELVQYAASLRPDERFKDLRLEGKADFAAEVAYEPTRSLISEVRCELRQVSVDHPKLPVRLHNLSAGLRWDGNKLTLERLKSAAGSGKIEAQGWADLADFENNFGLELTAHHLPFTKDLADRLASPAPLLHGLFKPVGRAHAKFSAEKTKGVWVRRYCTLEPDEISICFEKFKYPLHKVQGKLDYDFLQKASRFEAVGFAGDKPVTLRGNWKGLGAQAEAVIEVAGQDIVLDNAVMEALPGTKNAGLQGLAGSFHPTGKADFYGLICRVPGNTDYQSTYYIRFLDGSVRWDEFPYPLESVTGDLVVYPRLPGGTERYEFKNFHATHNGGEVYVSGRTEAPTAADGEGKLIVNIVGRNISLDNDLRTALALRKYGYLAKTWDAFSPAGRFNFHTQVQQTPSRPKDMDMDISVDVTGCALRPSFFKYPLHDVAAQFRYFKNRVEFANFTAQHNTSRMSIARGIIDLPEKGGFFAELDDLRGNPILADEEFLGALPDSLQKTARALNLKDQLLHLQTKLVVSQSSEPTKHAEIFWDGQMWVRDAALKAGIALDNVTGTVHCRGLYNGQKLAGLAGNIYLNEATIFKQPFRAVRSHFVVHQQTPDVMWFSLMAPLFRGEVSGQGRLELNSLLRYEVDLTASQIQLEDFGKYNMGPNHSLAGIAAGRLHLQGQGADAASLEGNGSIDVPSSPITRLLNLPLLLDLLKFLGLRLPDRTAFEEAHAAFAIHGQRVSISKLDLLGSAVSLYGSGEVNLDGTDLHLDMYTGWGRAEQVLPQAVRYIPSAISKQLLRIEVLGKISGTDGDLIFHKRPVPWLIDPIRGRMPGGVGLKSR